MSAKVDWNKFPLLDENFTLVHPKLIGATQALHAILGVRSKVLATVLGGTGAGKSHIMRELVKAILKKHAKEMLADLQYLPAIYYEIELLKEEAKFNWSLCYRELLTAAKHPNPRFKDLGEARQKLREVIRLRRIRYIFLDEADHLISEYDPTDTERIRQLANVIKSLVEGTGARIVLIGTYDLYPLVSVNGQLARRNARVHLQRYLPSKDDQQAFEGVLADLDKSLKGFLGFSLKKERVLVYEGCLGTIGVLCDWLAGAAAAAKAVDARTITLEIFEQQRLEADALEAILDDAENGEDNFLPDDEKREEFRKRVWGHRTKDRGEL